MSNMPSAQPTKGSHLVPGNLLGFNCLVFEHLDRNLYGLVKQQPFNCRPLKAISMIVQQVVITVFHSPLIIINRIHPSLLSYHRLMSSQLVSALETLKSIGVIHCDLSLPNVMLVNHEKQPFRIKVIDFGLAHEVSATPQGSTIQQCNYRSLTRAWFKFSRWLIHFFWWGQPNSCHHLTFQGSRGHTGSAPNRGYRHVVPGLLGCKAVPRCQTASWKNWERDG